MEYLLAVLVVAGFAYFVYAKVSKKRKLSSGSGSGAEGVRKEPGNFNEY